MNIALAFACLVPIGLVVSVPQPENYINVNININIDKDSDTHQMNSSFTPSEDNQVGIVQDDFSCDCKWQTGGCYIISRAPNNFACKCIYHGAWHCSGKVVDCISPWCQCSQPTLDYTSCMIGGGDCGGYCPLKHHWPPKPKHCDCGWYFGGCQITTRAPKGKACKCKYHFLDRCSGEVVDCNTKDCLCEYPDESITSCRLGQGDCGGYCGKT